MRQKRTSLLSLIEELPKYGKRHVYERVTAYRKITKTYRDLYEDTLRATNFLASFGLDYGDRLVLQAPNSSEWVSVFLGAMARGVVVVPVDPNFSATFLATVCAKVGPKLVICPAAAAVNKKLGDHCLASEEVAQSLAATSPLLRINRASTDDDTVEIVFTSGTTSMPRGVVLKHRNILANLRPIEETYVRWKRFVRPLQPLRFASLLPLSHMFGQMLGIFVPLALGATTLFCNPVGTPSLARLLKREKILCLFAVPRLLTDLAEHLRREMAASYGPGRFERLFVTMTNRKAWRRIVAFRRAHSFLGWRFWAFVVGGAATDPETIEFWRRLGYVVLQGYGLTETAPIVTVNNPFGPSLYSVGRPVGGQDVRLAPDGEILVRGENVTVGYFDDPDRTQQVFENGWLKTGDIGEFDEFGHLHIRGRKKDMIVTDEGMNVFPEEVERELNRHPLVRDSCVVGRRVGNRLVLHAVLLLKDPATDPERIIREVNPRLEVHQKLASASVWPFPDFPRTPTQKVKRGEVERVLAGAALASHDTKEADRLEAIVEVLGQGAATVPENAQLEKDLGLSSLDRVELACLVEERVGVQVDDTAIHADTSVAELKRLIETAPREGRRIPFPWWPRGWPVRMFRVAALHGMGFPILRIMCRVEARFFCDVNKLLPPLIFISNHTSHLDTPAILRALPYHLRVRLAPAMTTKYFAAYIEKKRYPFWERIKTGLAVRFLFAMGNVYFLPPTAGFRQTLEHTGRLLAAGYCPLVYPEGQISLTGRIGSFKPGIGMMVRAMQVPVVPIFVTGLAEILPPAARWPRRRGKGTVVFGSPLTFSTQTNEEIARTLESAVRHLAETISSSAAVSALS